MACKFRTDNLIRSEFQYFAILQKFEKNHLYPRSQVKQKIKIFHYTIWDSPLDEPLSLENIKNWKKWVRFEKKNSILHKKTGVFHMAKLHFFENQKDSASSDAKTYPE